jgi:muramoyltetrapeptide carboxypeptidase
MTTNSARSPKTLKTIKPAPLRTGQTIAVISPAGPAEDSRLDAGLRELERWGYRIKMGDHARGRHAYLSARDASRLEDLIQAFADPQVRAILCSRGGYGSGRLLAAVPYQKIARNPKIFVGFSDLTAFNWALYARARLISFTGPLVCEIGEGLPELTIRSFLELVSPAKPPDPLWRGNWQVIRRGRAVGPLFPGCLSLIVTLLGTRYLPNLTGGILLLEDLDEKPYQVDRMLVHLKNAGIFDKIAGIVIGRLTDCWPKTNRGQHLELAEVLLELTASHRIPIYAGIPYGHHPERLTLPVGVRVELSEKGGLRLLEDPLNRRTMRP